MSSLEDFCMCCAALKIHISGECKKYLDDLGGWAIERRGVIEIKVTLFH